MKGQVLFSLKNKHKKKKIKNFKVPSVVVMIRALKVKRHYDIWKIQ